MWLEWQPEHRVLLILLRNPRLPSPGLFPDGADRPPRARTEALPLKAAAVPSLLQSTPPRQEPLEEAPGPRRNRPRPNRAHHPGGVVPGHLSSLGRPDPPAGAALPLPRQKPDPEHQGAGEAPQCLPQSQLRNRDHAGGVRPHLPVPRQRQGEAVLPLPSLAGCRGPALAPGGRKREQPDVGSALDLPSQPLGEDSGAGQGLGLLGGGGEALVTTQGHLPGKRVPEPPLDAEGVVLGHPQLAGSVLAHARRQPCGSAPDHGPLQLLTAGPGPEHP